MSKCVVLASGLVVMVDADIEATADAEEQWLTAMNESTVTPKAFFQDCTPSYLSSEGAQDNPHGMLSTNFGGKPTEFFDKLADWRAAGRLNGVELA